MIRYKNERERQTWIILEKEWKRETEREIVIIRMKGRERTREKELFSLRAKCSELPFSISTMAEANSAQEFHLWQQWEK